MKERLKSFTAVFYTPILIYFVLFVTISLLAISASSPLSHVQVQGQNFVTRQAIFFLIGAIAAFLVMLMGMKLLRFSRWLIYSICLGALLLIFFIGDNSFEGCAATPGMLIPCINGATRWIDLGFINLQPSEFMRIALILLVADIIQRHNEKFLHEKRTFTTDLWLIIKSLAIVLIPAAFIFQQRDSGITILILITTAIMLIASGIKWSYIIVVGGGAVFLTITFITLARYSPEVLVESNLVEPYQLSRFTGWFDPFATISGYGHQLALGLQAMGTGGLFGHGFASNFLSFPEAHTDFIFAVIGMDFGLVGSAFVIIVSLLFNFVILKTAVLNRDHYTSHVCVGIFGSLLAQQFWNMGMVLGILPISGVTLPFISHGGSSVLASMIMLGIVLSSHVEGLTIKRNNTVFREDIVYFEGKSV